MKTAERERERERESEHGKSRRITWQSEGYVLHRVSLSLSLSLSPLAIECNRRRISINDSTFPSPPPRSLRNFRITRPSFSPSLLPSLSVTALKRVSLALSISSPTRSHFHRGELLLLLGCCAAPRMKGADKATHPSATPSPSLSSFRRSFLPTLSLSYERGRKSFFHLPLSQGTRTSER